MIIKVDKNLVRIIKKKLRKLYVINIMNEKREYYFRFYKY